jgi:serine beta-lactamase-like protein LACTB, mitochondrial
MTLLIPALLAMGPPTMIVAGNVRDEDGSLVVAPFMDLTDRCPSGGYVATAPDLARFGSAVFAAGYLTEAGRRLMLTPMRTAEGEPTGAGMAWRLGTDDTGRRVAHHGGEAMGSRAFLVVWPDVGVAVALLANVSFAPIGRDEALRIAELVVP